MDSPLLLLPVVKTGHYILLMVKLERAECSRVFLINSLLNKKDFMNDFEDGTPLHMCETTIF